MVRIITDSGSDILMDRAQEWNIQVIPLTVRFGDEEYEDGVTISRDDFYDKLVASKELPKTSQITPSVYEKAFAEAREAGDEVVCLTISSGLSGCYQSACIAREEFDNGIYVIDTKQACGSEYILVKHAVLLRAQGKSAKEIAATILAERDHSRTLTIMDTLEYLQKGGRISRTAAIAGTILGIKPLVTFENGVVEILAKPRGTKNAHQTLKQFIHKKHGIDWTRPIVFGYTGNSDALLTKMMTDISDVYEGRRKEDMPITRAGATIGTYCGPGVITIAFFEGNEE